MSLSDRRRNRGHRRRRAEAEAQAAADAAAGSFRVVLTGRPNVGKSTLFNRLVTSATSRGRKPRAIVHKTPGTTRDTRDAPASLAGMDFELTDTGGLEEGALTTMRGQITAATEASVRTADVVLFMIDAQAGVTVEDQHFASWLRRRLPRRGGDAEPAPVRVVVNKTEGMLERAPDQADFLSSGALADDSRWAELVADCYGLGFGDPLAMSAVHGDGLDDLYHALREARPQTRPQLSATSSSSAPSSMQLQEVPQGVPLPTAAASSSGASDSDAAAAAAAAAVPALQLAIMGRPNVGKSTLVNRLLGEQRNIVGPLPGVTRDAIPVPWSFDGRPICLVDTAGLRRPGKMGPSVSAVAQAAARAAPRHEEEGSTSFGAQKKAGPDVRAKRRARSPRSSQEHVSLGANAAELERLSAASAQTALQYAHAVVLVIDATEGSIPRQDLAIAAAAMDHGRALLVVVNKIDDVPSRSAALRGVQQTLAQQLPQAGEVPVLTMSALTGTGVGKLMPTVLDSFDRWRARVGTSHMNNWLIALQRYRPPPTGVRMRYITQVMTRPPQFTVFTNGKDVPDNYATFLRNELRKEFQLDGVPLRLGFKAAPGAGRGSAGDGKRATRGRRGRGSSVKSIQKQQQLRGAGGPRRRQ